MAAGESKPEESEGKWKMMFPKESKKDAPAPKYAFPTEDDEQDDTAHDSKPSYASTSSMPPISYPHPPPSKYEKYESAKVQPLLSHPPVGPSILDKFGNFRRADQGDMMSDKPPEPPSQHSRSRSRSRHSRSYSRSVSRSRSHSRRRRSSSRSYSRRSYSRSRSRSGSYDRRNRRRVGYYHNNNRPRFFNNRERLLHIN